MQGAKLSGEGRVYFRTSLTRRELSDYGCFEGFCPCKFDRNTFPPYSRYALYISVPVYYFSIILIELLIMEKLKFFLFQR